MAPNNRAECSLANVGTATIARVDLRFLLSDGTVWQLGDAVNVAPGTGFGLGVMTGVASVFVRCELKFVGTAAAVRANLLAVDAGGNTVASADAR